MTKTITTNRINLRIKKVDTIDKLNIALKLNDNKSINDIVNQALEVGLDILIDNSNLSHDTYGEQLDKNTRKILSKLNKIQSTHNKDIVKLLILVSVQEAMLSYLFNANDFEMNVNKTPIPDELKKEFFNKTPDLANELKEQLIHELLEDNDDEN